MPKKDWEENTVERILTDAGLWRFKKDEIISVLDVACGLSLKSKYLDAQIRVGVDIHEEYFNHIESDVPYVVMKLDIRNLREVFTPNSFDIVLVLDVIEHLEKGESLDVLQQCEAVAKKAVVLETPEGYIPQNIDIQGHGGDEWQTHRCGWEVSEIQDLGYETTVRDYQMSNVRRHTSENVDPDVKVINAIKYV